ncbi:hypothetical protein BUALT_Bualt02G0146100 [Buddleja alternifolia]|uniref:Protein kinase domain-containing protein n=1 Tax=Buddleja alternifolia TaxID=168488 RepID=A0AAV6Y8V4_9LAMI|nr:hypothetical protein BUALT_Bualt02G0146100 [Buddleja alternifolia]
MLQIVFLQSIVKKLKKPDKRMTWKRGERLGFGSFGSVHVVVNDDDSSPPLNGGDCGMAVKSAEISISKTLKKEAALLPQFKGCPHIIRCFGADESHENGSTIYNVFLEYAPGGSLANLIKNSKIHGGLSENQIKTHVKSLLLGLIFIHSSGYIHRDIKPDNILLDGNGNAKIADFGLAKKYGIKRSDRNKKRKGFIGTILYMAPEIIREGIYEPPVDIWALGCTVVEMITGKPLWDFPNPDPCAVIFKIGSGSPEIPKGLSEEAEDFVRKCLIMDPEKRWTAEMLLYHPFVMLMEEEKSIPCSMSNERELIRAPYVIKSPCNGGSKNWAIGCC